MIDPRIIDKGALARRYEKTGIPPSDSKEYERVFWEEFKVEPDWDFWVAIRKSFMLERLRTPCRECILGRRDEARGT